MPKPLLYILIFSVLLRVGVAFAFGDAITETRGGTHDQISYDALAQRVATGHGFSFATAWWPGVAADQPTAFWSYLYTLFLAAIYTIFGHHPLAARLIQAVLAGLLMPWLTYRLARRVFGSPSPQQEGACPEPGNDFLPRIARISRRQGGEFVQFVKFVAAAVPFGSGSSGSRGDVAALTAAAISAIYLYFITYAASLMTEALYITAILWTLDAAMRLAEALDKAPAHWPRIPRISRRLFIQNSSNSRNSWPVSSILRLRLGIELGLALGVTLLLRQVVAVFYPLLALWLLWLGWRRGVLRQALLPLIVAGLVAGATISPFVVRNYRVFGQLAMPNTNAGFAFFWANHPIYGTRFTATLLPSHGASYQELIPPEMRDLNDAALDRALLARGLVFVRDDPGRYLLLSLSRIPVYFQFWPARDSTLLSNASRVLSFGIFLPFMIYGVILVLMHLRRAPARSGPGTAGQRDLQPAYVVLFLLFIMSYTAVHLASWANVRYRLPVDAFLILFAAYGIENLVVALWRRRGV